MNASQDRKPVARKNTSSQSTAAKIPKPPQGGRVTTLIYRVIMPATEAINSQVAQYGFNVAGARVLDTLLSAGPNRVGKLCELTAIDNSTLSHLLRRLEKLGYIERTRPKDDNRSVLVSLTPEGEQVAIVVAQLSNETEKVFLNGFSKEEIDALKASMRRILLNTESCFVARK
jgi:MarR family transcriptional regulator, organic hydroperoxide resistance regulator